MLQTGLYVGISGQLALQRRLDTIAQNVANSSTAGYRAEEVKFEALISQASVEPVAFASSGESFLSRRVGETVPTGNPLDVAVQGDAWLSIQTPAGAVFTRDGRMKMQPAGELQTLAGNPVLDDGGAPISLDPRAGPPEIGRDGTIVQNGRQVGRIGLFTIAKGAKLTRYENSGVIPDRQAEPVTDFNGNGVVQGFMERSNVNAVLEMTNLISVSRSFDAVTNALNETDNTMREAIQTLGAGTK